MRKGAGGFTVTAAQKALIAFVAAFAVAATIATLTTIRQVRMEASSSVAQPSVSTAGRIVIPIRPGAARS